jgi:hypothetical protein
MKKCEVIEQGDGWLVRDIMLKDVPLREKVTFEPEQRVIFERTRGSELGRIENIIGEDANGNLTLTFAFSLKKDGVPEGSEGEGALRADGRRLFGRSRLDGCSGAAHRG